MSRYDVIVLGAGGMGSAALWALAQRGVRALGIEQHALGHAHGASHAQTRLIRQAYFEHPDYVPLLQEVYGLWERLEREWGKRLFHKTGLVIFGPETHPVITGIRASRDRFGLPVDEIPAERAATWHPALKPPTGDLGLYEPAGGWLAVEECCIAMGTLARRAGAFLVEGERVHGWSEGDAGVEVRTDRGLYNADRLIVCPGPWAAQQLPWLAPRISVHRVPLFWLQGHPQLTMAAKAPCFAFCREDGFYYGFPALDARGVKVGLHAPGTKLARQEDIDRSWHDDDAGLIERFARDALPGSGPKPIDHATCLYSMTPDEHFIVDRRGRVSYAAGFSGHGFKFAAVIGEILADLALDGDTTRPISILRERWP